MYQWHHIVAAQIYLATAVLKDKLVRQATCALRHDQKAIIPGVTLARRINRGVGMPAASRIPRQLYSSMLHCLFFLAVNEPISLGYIDCQRRCRKFCLIDYRNSGKCFFWGSRQPPGTAFSFCWFRFMSNDTPFINCYRYESQWILHWIRLEQEITGAFKRFNQTWELRRFSSALKE